MRWWWRGCWNYCGKTLKSFLAFGASALEGNGKTGSSLNLPDVTSLRKMRQHVLQPKKGTILPL